MVRTDSKFLTIDLNNRFTYITHNNLYYFYLIIFRFSASQLILTHVGF